MVEQNNVTVPDHDDDEDDNDEYHIISYQEEAEDEVNDCQKNSQTFHKKYNANKNFISRSMMVKRFLNIMKK